MRIFQISIGSDGAASPHPRCLYSGSGLFRGGIERFCKKIESQKEFRTSEGVPLVTFTEMTDPAKIPIHGVKN
mgnify:CR=1 FL=1